MGSYDKIRHNVILISCCIVIAIAAIVFISVFISAGNEEKKSESKIIAQIDKFTINEDEFKFFSRIILNQEEETVKNLYTAINLSAKDEIKKYTSNFAHEYMVRVLEAEKEDIKLTADEKAQLEKQFETDYETAKNVDGKILSKEEFYKYFYGITEKEYKKFWTNWYIIDKHTVQNEQKADVTETMQEMAFREYYDFLHTYNVSMIVLKIDSENTKEAQVEKANTIVSSLNSGTAFDTLFNENNTDESLAKDKGEVLFYPSQKYTYGEVYDWLRISNVGDTGAVATDMAVYVLKLNKITDFETLKNTDTMIKWTRTFSVNMKLNEIMQSDKYNYKVNSDLYNKIDLSEELKEAYEYWTSVWENDKK